jgi:hypothetical protein
MSPALIAERAARSSYLGPEKSQLTSMAYDLEHCSVAPFDQTSHLNAAEPPIISVNVRDQNRSEWPNWVTPYLGRGDKLLANFDLARVIVVGQQLWLSGSYGYSAAL